MNISLYTITSFSIILLFSLVLSIQDIKTKSVSLFIQWASVFAALICHMSFAREGMWINIISSMIMGSLYFAVRKVTKGKLGAADVWFGFFQGLFIIPQLIPFCLIIEDCLALIFINKRYVKEPFPFIPFMSIGLVISYIISIIK